MRHLNGDMKVVAIGFVIFILSFVGTEFFRRLALSRNFMLDIPNERSSHRRITPRGAGLVFVILCFMCFSTLWQIEKVFWFTIGAFIVCFISLLDDLKSIPAGVRLLFHFIAAFIFVYPSENSVLSLVFGVFWIAWLVNAYNFMDGIDGIASIQALIAGTGWIVVSIFFDLRHIELVSLFLVASLLGFLPHNLPPARVFMGDTGSAFLGYSFAGLPLMSESKTFLVFTFMSVFLFIFDTVFTLLRRIYKRERFWKAHRSHLYQRLVISGLSHGQVTLIYGLLSLLNILSGLLYLFRENLWYLLVPLTSAVFTLFLVFYREGKQWSS